MKSIQWGMSSRVEAQQALAFEKDSNGRPIYKDVNGKTHEIRTTADIEAFKQTGASPMARPRMQEYRNPITGRTSWEPSRAGGLKPHPVTGEPMEIGPVLREHEKMIDMGTVSGEFIPPSHTQTGIPIDPVRGVAAVNPADRPLGIIDPETKKPMKASDMWSDSGTEIKTRKVAVKRPPAGMKWK